MKTIRRLRTEQFCLFAVGIALAVVTLACNALSGLSGGEVEWHEFTPAAVQDIFKSSASALGPADRLLDDITEVSFTEPGIAVSGPYTKADGSPAQGSYLLSLEIKNKLYITIDDVQVEGVTRDDPRLERLATALAAGITEACKGSSRRVTFDYIEFSSDRLRLKVRN